MSLINNENFKNNYIKEDNTQLKWVQKQIINDENKIVVLMWNINKKTN